MPRYRLLSATLPLTLLLAVGCDGGEVSCGPGTVLVEGVCTVDDPAMPTITTDAGMPPMDDDAGPPTGGTDAGTSEWGINPPGTPPPPPGCDEGTGECDAWEDTLLGLIAAHPGRGCGATLNRDAGAQMVASQHASYQASIDRLSSSSPDGDLFVQVRDAGSSFMYAGATFSVTRDGASDVMGRWAMNPDAANVLAQCWTGAGVAISTSASGASYVSVLLTR